MDIPNPWVSTLKDWAVFCLGKDFLFKSILTDSRNNKKNQEKYNYLSLHAKLQVGGLVGTNSLKVTGFFSILVDMPKEK